MSTLVDCIKMAGYGRVEVQVHVASCWFFLALLLTSPVLADSNASGGNLVDSETVSLGFGPFDHASSVGDANNSVVNNVAFTGGFTATHVRFAGTLTSIIPTTWGSEANIQIRQGAASFDWENPGPDNAFEMFDYDASRVLTGDFAGGIDPIGTWDVEFFEVFDDSDAESAGPVDSESTNVDMTFEERLMITDSNGEFDLGSLNVGDTNNSEGEFALSDLYDLYSLTLNEAGFLTLFTDADSGGFVGKDADTEIAVFDSNGFLLAENDDDPDNELFSRIDDLALEAGDYTLAVTSYLMGESFADGFVVNPGPGTGDYIISASFASSVPEPGTMFILGLGFVGGLVCRRRKP